MEHTRHVAFDAPASAEEAARRNHYEGEMVTESFWRSAATSLPPHARRKYAHLFEAAEQWEPVIEFLADACSSAWRAVAGLFQGGQARHGSRRHKNLRGIRRA